VLSSTALAMGFVCTVLLDILLIPPHAGIGAPVASAIAYSAAGAVIAVLLHAGTRCEGNGSRHEGSELSWFAVEAPRFAVCVPGWAAP
jgi:hypothetical protein